MKTYWIHDNYARPFKVCILNDLIRVYTKDEKLLLTFDRIKNIFIGKSKLCPMTKFSAGWGSHFDGNSILLDLGGLKYVFIGWKIQEFTALAPIIKYESPVGNNDFPYPWAEDDQGNYYLLIEGVILHQVQVKKDDDPYQIYYKLDKELEFPKIQFKTLVERQL